jgi:hypothetical protein
MGLSLGDIVEAVTAPVTAPVKAIVKGTEAGGKVVGKALEAGGKAVAGTVEFTVDITVDAAGEVGKAISGIPYVGEPLYAAFDAGFAGPFKLAQSIADGKRIDKAVYERLKADIKNAQTLAPYAQAVVSLVPGVGTGVAGAIGAANALSKGKPIDEAVIAGVRGAVPGGPVGQAAFDVAIAGMSGKSIEDTALAAIPLDPEQKKIVIAGIKAARDIAQGKEVDEVLVEKGMSLLDPETRKAVQIGMAMGQAQNLQGAMQIGTKEAIDRLMKEGYDTIKRSDVYKEGSKLLTDDAKRGYTLAVAVLNRKSTPVVLETARNALKPEERKGFDVVIAARAGETLERKKALMLKSPKKQPPRQRFMSLLVRGMHIAPSELRANISLAIKQGKRQQFHSEVKTMRNWLDKILSFLGLKRANAPVAPPPTSAAKADSMAVQAARAAVSKKLQR